MKFRTAAAFWPGKNPDWRTMIIWSDLCDTCGALFSLFFYIECLLFIILLMYTNLFPPWLLCETKHAVLITHSAQASSTYSNYAGYCPCQDQVICSTRLVLNKPDQYARPQTFVIQQCVTTQTSTCFKYADTLSCKQASLTTHCALVKHRCN